jgi:hypothetical protein
MATTELLLYDPQHADAEIITVAGFLAGYSGRTREAYSLDLRQFIAWCKDHSLPLFQVQRTHIELFARELELAGRARPRSVDGWPRSSASTDSPKRKESSTTHQPPEFVVPACTTSPRPSGSTATSSERSS